MEEKSKIEAYKEPVPYIVYEGTMVRFERTIRIPDSVTSIGSNAFSSCRSLASLAFEPTNPPTAGSSAFNNLPSDLVVYVPAGTLSAYQSASNYSSISSKMVEMSA